MPSRIVAVIVAAGSGSRMGSDVAKQYMPLFGKPMLHWSLMAFFETEVIDEMVLVVPVGDEDYVRETVVKPCGEKKKCEIVAGGATRQESTQAGIANLAEDTIAVIHDAARPVISRTTIEQVVSAATESEGALAAIPIADTIKRVDRSFVVETIPRETLWAAQTPQAFRVDILRQAAEAARRDGFLGTDEASLVERIGKPVRIVEDSRYNIKVTTPEDMRVAETFLAAMGKICCE